jgi:hypothetical protein
VGARARGDARGGHDKITKKFEGKEKQGRHHPVKWENITGIEFLARAGWETNAEPARRSFGLAIEASLSEKHTNLLRPG